MDPFCWTKMGAESGEGLDRILNRKEIERVAGNGLFLWGIGNALGNSITAFTSSVSSPRVLFSPMKSAAKKEDVNPDKVFLWTSYYDCNDEIQSLPDHAFVTSRTDKRHYALFCNSDVPLCSQDDQPVLAFNMLRNFKTKSPLGFSQVTAVVDSMTDEEFLAREPGHKYQVLFSAELVDPFYVKLAEPFELNQSEVQEALMYMDSNDLDRWRDWVHIVKTKHTNSSPKQISLALG